MFVLDHAIAAEAIILCLLGIKSFPGLGTRLPRLGRVPDGDTLEDDRGGMLAPEAATRKLFFCSDF